MRWLLIAMLAAGVAAMPATAAQAPDPCVLLTTTDASTVLGKTPPKPKAKTLGLYRSCTYAVGRKTMTVQTRRIATQALFDKSAKANRGGAFPVQGVGADTWSVAGGTALLVWKNGVEVTIAFSGVSPFVATQQSLAKTAVGRL